MRGFEAATFVEPDRTGYIAGADYHTSAFPVHTTHLLTIQASTGVDLPFVCGEGKGNKAGVLGYMADGKGAAMGIEKGASSISFGKSGKPTGMHGVDVQGVRQIAVRGSMIVLQSDRPRLIAREQDLQNQMRHLGSKQFLFGQGPERMQINTELMKLRSQLSEVSKQLNRPVVWYK